MIYLDDRYILSTGKKFYSNCGIIGINNDLNISEGYDGGLYREDYTKQEEKK